MRQTSKQKTLSITFFPFYLDIPRRQNPLAKMATFYYFSGFLAYQNAKVNSESYSFFYSLSNELSQNIPSHLKKKLGVVSTLKRG